jgi:transposase
MDVLAAYQQVGSYRAAAQMCGTTHKTVKRIVERHEAGGGTPGRKDRGHNYDEVSDLVAKRVADTKARISAKRLLPEAVAAGYEGSARNFRRLVAEQKTVWRQGNHRGRRPAVWVPGDTLVIDWGVLCGLHVFCAVLAWSRWRFVRFAADEKAATTLGLLAECFEHLGGTPKVVLADRMGCLKGQVVANLVVPTPHYVRFAAHYRFRPDFCNGHDPASKGIVENLVGYAKTDLMIPTGVGVTDLASANREAVRWCGEVNSAGHSQIAAVPDQRLEAERLLLTALPSLRPDGIGMQAVSRKVDRLSCVRFASARYSVPNRLIGASVLVAVDGEQVRIVQPFTGEVLAEHPLTAPGEVSIRDEHYGSHRPDKPARSPRPKTVVEKRFLALGPVAEAFLTGAAAAGVSRLPGELEQILTLVAAHGHAAVLAALQRAVVFKRWRADDVRSILAAGGTAPVPRPAGQVLLLTLPQVPTRSLSDYAIGGDGA